MENKEIEKKVSPTGRVMIKDLSGKLGEEVKIKG